MKIVILLNIDNEVKSMTFRNLPNLNNMDSVVKSITNELIEDYTKAGYKKVKIISVNLIPEKFTPSNNYAYVGV